MLEVSTSLFEDDKLPQKLVKVVAAQKAGLMKLKKFVVRYFMI